MSLTAYHLKATGQTRNAGMRVWTVVDCDCSLCILGKHVAVDEHSELTDGPRHFSLECLRVFGTPGGAADQADRLAPVRNRRKKC